jgi:hypothetical protein
MSAVSKEHLLTAAQMARFACDGYLVFPGFVPDELNKRIHADQEAGNGHWHSSDAIKELFEWAPVKGIVQSLVGESPPYDHSALHVVRAGQKEAQVWHADSIIDTRPFGFDIQAMYFSHDAPPEMGPTLILPGSHLRRVSNVSIGRYKNITGQKQLAGPAGTIAFLHQALWHCAQPNQLDKTRYMFKLRLRPGQEQRGLFNTEGYDSKEVRDVLYGTHHSWHGDQGRAEHVQRAKLWRYLSNDDRVDVSFEGVLTRMGI